MTKFLSLMFIVASMNGLNASALALPQPLANSKALFLATYTFNFFNFKKRKQCTLK